MNNTTSIAYSGYVDFKLKVKDKVISIKNHNTGTEYLKKSFVKFITGNYGGDCDIPRYLDLRKKNNNNVWESCLTQELPISSRYFEHDTSEGWVARFTSSIKFEILKAPISELDTSEYKIVMYSGYDASIYADNYHDIAELPVTAQDLSVISPGTQGIVEWTMKISNAVEGE